MKNLMISLAFISAAALWASPSWGTTAPATNSYKKVLRKAAVKPMPPTANTQAAALRAAAMTRAPAAVAGTGGSRDISEELKIMGQSRNLSMGLLFQKDKDKLTFGTPRTNYQDKISDKNANF
jgi:hypothetical protein